MCGRFTLRDPVSHPISKWFGPILESAEQAPRFNVAPSNNIVIGVATYKRSEPIHLWRPQARFGFLPNWASPDTKPQINARSETLSEKPFFRDAFRKSRCLVPADGWYEWKTEEGKKVPYFVQRPDHTGFFFAGLYSVHLLPDGTTRYTFCIVTSEASEDLGSLHERMPVIVPEEHWRDWLLSETKPEVLQSILKPGVPGTYIAERVSTYVNRPANEGPDCIKPEEGRPLGCCPGGPLPGTKGLVRLDESKGSPVASKECVWEPG
jgi:putative SOS response-associated peptidase YedK